MERSYQEKRIASSFESKGDKKRYKHEVVILNDKEGTKVGEVVLMHYTAPKNFYYVAKIEVYKGARGVGLGREIVNSINRFLINKNAVGVLYDNIRFDGDNHEGAYDFYERHGWKYFNNNKILMFFNAENLEFEEKREIEKVL